MSKNRKNEVFVFIVEIDEEWDAHSECEEIY